MSEKLEYITREEFDSFVQYSDQRYASLFNRVLGLDMVLRTIILPLASSEDTAIKLRHVLELLDGVKSNLLKTGAIAPEHQQDVFLTLDLIVNMFQDILQKSEAQGDEKNEA